RGVGIVEPPEELCERQRLAPVRHREAGVGPLGVAEGGACVVVLEVVKQSDAVQEGLLGRARARVGKVDDALPLATVSAWLVMMSGVLCRRPRRRANERRREGQLEDAAHDVLTGGSR